MDSCCLIASAKVISSAVEVLRERNGRDGSLHADLAQPERRKSGQQAKQGERQQDFQVPRHHDLVIGFGNGQAQARACNRGSEVTAGTALGFTTTGDEHITDAIALAQVDARATAHLLVQNIDEHAGRQGKISVGDGAIIRQHGHRQGQALAAFSQHANLGRRRRSSNFRLHQHLCFRIAELLQIPIADHLQADVIQRDFEQFRPCQMHRLGSRRQSRGIASAECADDGRRLQDFFGVLVRLRDGSTHCRHGVLARLIRSLQAVALAIHKGSLPDQEKAEQHQYRGNAQRQQHLHARARGSEHSAQALACRGRFTRWLPGLRHSNSPCPLQFPEMHTLAYQGWLHRAASMPTDCRLACPFISASTGAAEPACTPIACIELVDHLEPRAGDGHEHQLRNAISRLHQKLVGRAIQAGNHQRSLVVGIDQANPIAEHDAVLVAEP
jgi:hypothetical protein